ncbi:MAG: VOC family protein [Acidimicrobiales bacterium]
MEVRWITAFVDRGPDRFDPTVEFWSVISGTSVSAWRGSDTEFATLLPSDGSDAHLRLQRTRGGSSGSHIDLHVADVRAGAEECVGSGAATLDDNGDFVVLASPGGMPFCIVGHHGEEHRQRPVVSAPGGAATLVDQVSIDCDPDVFDDEVRFWSSITGWPPLPARAGEFVPLDRPAALPLRIMLQRRAQALGPTSCHLDLACDDVAAAVDQHVGFGAALIARHDRWTVMADPSGVAYCLTSRRAAP